jgi:formate hydrogenlyase subunit 3/multisubunit Na+/H+ antiporter MnhD subunit
MKAIVISLPLLISVIVILSRLPVKLHYLLAFLAPLPAFIVALGAPSVYPQELPWLLLEASLLVTPDRQVFLLFTALVWLASGLFSVAYLTSPKKREQYLLFFYLCMAGNFGIYLANDTVTFYSCFSIMTISAYGLILHSGTPRSRRAGRIYLTMAILGEAFLFLGLILLARIEPGLIISDSKIALARSDSLSLVVVLLMVGFGVKSALFGLHMWLPLAHPVAPVPASAVLSGSIIKAGVFGWYIFLPSGLASLHIFGQLFIVFGLAGAFLAVLVGLTQRESKVVLAYSSVSQMGIAAMIMGLGMSEAEAWAGASAVILVFVLNHAMAKTTLFLSVGAINYADTILKKGWVYAGIILASLSLAGAPFTAGYIAKSAAESLTFLMPSPWKDLFEWLLPLATVGTSLLLLHFIIIFKNRPERLISDPSTMIWISWSIMVTAVAFAIWITIPYLLPQIDSPFLTPYSFLMASLPILGATLILFIALKNKFVKQTRLSLPAGDMIIVFERMLFYIRQLPLLKYVLSRPRPQIDFALMVENYMDSSEKRRQMLTIENGIRRFSNATMIFIVLVLAIILLTGV